MTNPETKSQEELKPKKKAKKASKKKASKKSKKKTKKRGKPGEPGPGGRPTKYKKEYCQGLIDHMSQGNSFETYGNKIDVCYETLYAWVREKKEFSEAKRKGEAKSLEWYENLAKGQMTGTLRRTAKETVYPDGRVIKEYAPVRGDSRTWGITMRSRFRKFGYANKVEVTGKDGGPITTRPLKSMTEEELDREIERHEKALKK